MTVVSARFLTFILILLTFELVVPDAARSQNLPPLNMVIMDSSATQGYYFLIPYTNSPPYTYNNTMLILDHIGRVVFYRYVEDSPGAYQIIDFKIQPDGRMSYFNLPKMRFYLMDSTFMVVDSIECLHGFTTDQHDLKIIPGGHYLLFGTETRIMNLSSYHWFGFNHTQPGSASAQVMGVVIQEFDENKNLVWEWKGHDHYQFGDVNQTWLMNPNKVDWTHANAVECDQDGNVLLSLRHFNEITKISRTSGNIIWRFGGKQNQFQFLNDTIQFTGQHDIRRVSPTSITLFDNGQYTNPRMCRALEYQLDETALTADLVWDYVYDSSMYSAACGSFQTLENGNRIIDFGFTNSGYPWMVAVKPDRSKIAEMWYPSGYSSYRSFNYPQLPWQLHRPVIECRKTGGNYYLEADPGYDSYSWSTGDTTASIQISDTGTYWVFVPYGTGFISSEPITVTDPLHPCVPVGMASTSGSDGVEVMCLPNPATDRIRILFDLPAPAAVCLTLTDLLGKTVQINGAANYPSGRHEQSFDVSSLSGGIYIVSLTTEHERIIRKVVIR